MKASRVVDIVIPVYNDNPYLEETLVSIFSQQLPESWMFHVYVVDDGSDNEIKVNVPEKHKKAVSILRLSENKGCSVARNKGTSTGKGEVILFLDADCSLSNNHVIALLLEQYMQGFDVCFGQIHAPQCDFWAKYQNEVAQERAIRFRQGELSSMTTQIVLIKRSSFKLVGGFDEAYHFGFEDRDLFISLIKSGARISLEEKALVNHNDQLSLRSVTKKLFKSSESSSKRFIQKHPKEYKYLPYAKADVRYSTDGVRILAYIAKPMLWPLVRVVSWGINKRLFPFYVAKKLVKYTSGLAYLIGTKAAQDATG